MSLKEKLLSKIRNPKLRSTLENPATRARFFFAVSIFGGTAFAVFNAVAGILYGSIWYGSLALYYIMLVVQKILLVICGKVVVKKFSDSEQKLVVEKWRIYLANGIFLLVLDLALTVAIVQMASTQKPDLKGQIFAIATAAYAFFRITTAIINLVKARKTDDTLLQVIRNINFVAATVSMLALTSTLICTFGDFAEMQPLLVAVSVCTGAIIVGLGILMIVKGTFQLRRCYAIPAEAEQ